MYIKVLQRNIEPKEKSRQTKLAKKKEKKKKPKEKKSTTSTAATEKTKLVQAHNHYYFQDYCYYQIVRYTSQ